MSPTRPETAKTVRCVNGRYHDPCVNSFMKCASAANARNAYSTDALVKKPRCGSNGSSRLSQKNVGVRLEILMFVIERSMPGSSACSA